MISVSSFIAAADAPASSNILARPEIMFVGMIILFYFLMIRPQQKQRKEHAARLTALQNGDKVVTSAGIYGIVHNIKETTVVLKVAESTMIEFDKAAIATVSKKDAK